MQPWTIGIYVNIVVLTVFGLNIDLALKPAGLF